VLVRCAQLRAALAAPLKRGIERYEELEGFPLWPCLGQGASLGEEAVLADSGWEGEITARVGRVRSLAFLSILLGSALVISAVHQPMKKEG